MENSKFRFWVKAKGFRLGLNDADSSTGGEILYVPASKLTSVSFQLPNIFPLISCIFLLSFSSLCPRLTLHPSSPLSLSLSLSFSRSLPFFSHTQTDTHLLQESKVFC